MNKFKIKFLKAYAILSRSGTKKKVPYYKASQVFKQNVIKDKGIRNNTHS